MKYFNFKDIHQVGYGIPFTLASNVDEALNIAFENVIKNVPAHLVDTIPPASEF
jgi:hypothetical protein